MTFDLTMRFIAELIELNQIHTTMKTILTLCCLLGLAGISEAHFISDSRCLGGSADEHSSQVISSSSGGFVIVGSSTSSLDGDVTLENHGEQDAWIVRLNDLGEIQWQLLLGGSENDVATGIVEMPAGEFFVCGYTYSDNGDFNEHQGSTSTSDIFLVKISSEGNLMWLKTLGTSYDDKSNDVICTGNNRIAVGGTVQGNGTDVEAILGLKDMWIVELDGNGNIIWESTYGGALNDELHHLAFCPDGGMYLAGASESMGNIPGDMEGTLIKVNTNGQFEWQVNLGSTEVYDDAHMSSFQSQENGEVLVGFTTTGWELDGINCTAHGSVLVAKINGEGELLDTWCYGGSALDFATRIFTDSEQNNWIIATTRSSDGDVINEEINPGNDRNGWLIRANETGDIVESFLIGGTGQDYSSCMAESTSGRMIATLETYSTDGDAQGQHGELGSNTSDVLVVFLEPESVGVSEFTTSTEQLKVYPNPADDVVTLRITDSESDDEDRIVVHDVTGRVVLENWNPETFVQFSVNEWNAGLYVIQWISKNKPSLPIRLIVE